METPGAAGRARERERRMGLTAVASGAARVASIGVNLATVPLALRYLGTEQYGLWLVLVTTVAWLGFAQFGMASSLLNNLAEAEGRSDRGRAAGLVATAWWYQIAVSGALVVLLLALLPVLPLRALLNAGKDVDLGPLRAAAALLWVGFVLSLPVQIGTTVFQAKQEGYLAHLWDLARSALRFAAIVIVVRTDLGIAGLAAAYALPPLLGGIASVVHLFGLRHRPLAPRPGHAGRVWLRPLLRLGVQFTGLTLAGLVVSYTDNLVIAHVLGPIAVPPYAVTFMLAQLVILLVMMLLDAAWPAYVEAASRGDAEWVRRTHQRLVRVSLAAAAGWGIVLLAVGRPLIRLWAGPDIVPSTALLGAMALLVVVQSVPLCYGRLTTALGGVAINMWLGLLNAAINLPASILLARWIGLPGVALGTVIGYVVLAIPLIVFASRALAALSAGRHARAELEPLIARP